MSKYVAVSIDGVISVHAPPADGLGAYDTLCGLDANDPTIGHSLETTPRNAKIDCSQCRALWRAAQRLCAVDFVRRQSR